jgi:hypothetical protein
MLDLDKVNLKRGAHTEGSGEMCVMECASMLAGEDWSDTPKCVSPIIGAFMRNFNDSVDDDTRQKLKRFIPLVMNTNTGAADDLRRSWMAMDWLVRVHVPAWLDLAKLDSYAAAIRGGPEIVDGETLADAMPSLIAGQKKADAAWDAARDAARDPARAAARAAAWDAARAAACPAWDPDRDDSWHAAWAAVWYAAWAAARDPAARDAARDALKPTVTTLQESAFGLIERMCAVGK